MCRLFGFRSVIFSQVHSSLVAADNALKSQGIDHPDGWGVAYYLADAPHIIKSKESVLDDHLFTKVSGLVSSQTVLAHIRKSTQGSKNILNTHPFQFGKWVFAHNGNIKEFDKYKETIKSKIQPELRRFILGETDSEVLFYFILSHIQNYNPLSKTNIEFSKLKQAVEESISELTRIIGPYSKINDAGPDETYLTFILTNGDSMISHHGGKDLFYSTYKTKCSDSNTCQSYAPECEAATTSGSVNHLIFSSEELSGENIWLPVKAGQVIGVDATMKLHI